MAEIVFLGMDEFTDEAARAAMLLLFNRGRFEPFRGDLRSIIGFDPRQPAPATPEEPPDDA